MENKINENELNEILDRRAEREEKHWYIDLILLVVVFAIIPLTIKILFF